MSPFSQPQLSNIFFRFPLLLYTSLKCCFNWHKEKKLPIIWAPAPVSCQMSTFSSLQFLVHYFYSVSLILKLSLSLALFISLCFSGCFLKLLVSASLLNTRLFPTDCLCCFPLPLSSLSTYLHLPVVSTAPDSLLWTALCLALTSKLLYVASLFRYEYRNQTVLIHCSWESTGSNQKAVRFSTNKKQTKI